MSMSRARLKEELFRLLEEDREFRYAVAGLLGIEEILRRMDENIEMTRRLQEQVAGLQEQVGRLQEQMNEHSRAIRALQKQVLKQGESIERLNTTIQAVGMRYGVFTEEAFREGVKHLVRDLLGEYQVDRWVHYDEEGIVYGHPSIIEVGVLVKDGEHILVEYKSMADKSDVAKLHKIGKLYEKHTGTKPRLLLVSPIIRKRARELAEELGIETRGNTIES